MNRRDFIGTALQTAGLASLAGCAGLPLGSRMRLGCQLWSVKDIWQKTGGVTSVFPQLAAMGYEGVQSMAFWQCDPDELERTLAASNLAVADMPISFKHVDTDAAFEKTVRFCRRFDVDFVYIPWWKPKTLAGWTEFAEKLDALGQKLAPYGIRAGYHHHIHEINEKLDGAHPFDLILRHPTFNFEIDVGPVLEAGRDPAKTLIGLRGRVPGLHAKPYPGTYAGAPDDRQDWPAILAAARAIGTKWIVVECEQRKDTFDDVRRSADYLRPKMELL